jgi:peptidoglycan hydrolase-like protein with peptidoglycan-binding domain
VKGKDVVTWQTRMKQRGWTLTIDGNYGPASESVCKQFQKEKKLRVDGIVGKETWDAAWRLPVS